MLINCPRCSHQFEPSKITNDFAVCACGWNGSITPNSKKKKKSQFETAHKKSISTKGFLKFSAMALSALALTYGVVEWKGFFAERAVYSIKSSVRLNSAQDEYRMALICHKLQKQNCKEISLHNAFKKDAKNTLFNGEYAITLTESGKHDQAILAYQRFFSQEDGNWRHEYNYAKSLGEKEYYNDAKEWYYKAIRSNPNNLEIAESMMSMLTKSFNFGEALSIIGHFNMNMPQTQKTWHKLSIDIKNQFKEYQQKYNVKNMTVSKLGSYFFAPAIVGGAMDIQLFIVNPESIYTTVDLTYLKNNGIPYEDNGAISVSASGGQTISGTKVVLPALIFGAFSLNAVEAVACDNCAFVAGKSILDKLNIKTAVITNTNVNILSMSEK